MSETLFLIASATTEVPFEYPTWSEAALYLGGILFFLLLNAFFVASEFAIVKVRPGQIEGELESKPRRAGISKHVVNHLDGYLSANLLFTLELQRRLTLAGSPLRAIAAHPGWSATNLQQRTGSRIQHGLMAMGNKVVAQSDEQGAWPTLYAATSPDVHGGGYYGPGGLMEMRGYPKEVKSNEKSRDEAVAAQLWDVSEELTGVEYTI